MCSEVRPPVVIQVLDVHRFLAAILIDGSLRVLKQVLQVVTTGPYQPTSCTFGTPSKIWCIITEAPRGSLRGERTQHLLTTMVPSHCTRILSLATMYCMGTWAA